MKTVLAPVLLILQHWLSPSFYANALFISDQGLSVNRSNESSANQSKEFSLKQVANQSKHGQSKNESKDVKACENEKKTCICPDITLNVRDARKLQEEAASPLDFFFEHGFVLVPGHVFLDDAETILKEVFVGSLFERMDLIKDAMGEQRGPDPAYENYMTGNVQETALNLTGFAHNMDTTRELPHRPFMEYYIDQLKPEVFYWLDVWGTENMEGPLMHRPLALADPKSVNLADVQLFTTANGLIQSKLKCQSDQNWYYYPEMRTNEVLVSIAFMYTKDDQPQAPYLRSVFHGEFENPLMPRTAERQQSAERKFLVFFNETIVKK